MKSQTDPEGFPKMMSVSTNASQQAHGSAEVLNQAELPRKVIGRREFLQITGGAVLAASVSAALVPASALGAKSAARRLASSPAPASDPNVIWSIGTTDHSGDEFAAKPADSIRYDIARGAEPNQWPEKQDSARQNYGVRFDLPEKLSSPAALVIEGFFLEAGPRGVVISVNGKRGWFHLTPRYARDLDMRQGNWPTHTGVTLRAEIDPSLLQQGSNEISIALDGRGILYYDSLRLERSAASLSKDLAVSVEPTFFYRRAGAQLLEVTEIILRPPQPLKGAAVVLTVGSSKVSGKAGDKGMDFGEQLVELEVPAIDAPQPYVLTVAAQDGEKRFEGTFRPEKQWKLFAGLKVHNDVGYTDSQQNVEELDGRNTDRVIEFASRYPDYKFNLEVAWLADNYARMRKPARMAQLMKLAQQDRVGIGGLYLNLISGSCTGEELYRALYVGKGLQRKYGVQIKVASLTDTPSQCWALPSLLADAGMAGFVLASNQHRGPLLVHSRLNEESPFYWEGPDGRRMPAFFSRTYHQMNRIVSRNNPSLKETRQSIGQLLTRYQRDDYVPDALYLFGQMGDNAVLNDEAFKAIEEWNKAYAFPQLIAATDADYFDYIAKHFEGKLPVLRGDGGAFWADGAGSSTAATVLNHHSQHLLPLAEAVAACAAMLDSNLAYPADAFRDAWREVLFYDEHTWGAHNSITQPDRQFVTSQFEFKQAHAVRAHWAANDLLSHACARLTQNVTVDVPVLFVFNPSLHARSDVVETELDSKRRLVDLSSGKSVPVEIVSEKDKWRRVRFAAENVPGLGYKSYEVRAGDAADSPSVQERIPDSWEIESRYYRVVLDPKTGAIVHLIDKDLGRDLADPGAPFGLNQLVYAAGGEGQQIVSNVAPNPPTQLDVSGQEGARLVENVRTPFGRRIRIQAQAKNVPLIESEIAIYDRLKRIDIRNHIRKEDVRAKEAIYFAFPFRVTPPELQYQVQNAWARPNVDQLPGACRDWFATSNLVLSRDAGVTIAFATPDLPLVTLTDINRGRWLEHLDVSNGHVYSYVTNNYWSTNIKASQGGDITVRYFISSAKNLDYDVLGRFDAETRSSLFPYSRFDRRNETGPRRMPADSGSLLQIEAPNAQFSAFKEAEDGNGYILRLRETSGKDGQAVVRCPWLPIEQAFLTNGVEENATPLVPSAKGVAVPLKAWRFMTVRLMFGSPSL
jgi:alpha-mannosidase